MELLEYLHTRFSNGCFVFDVVKCIRPVQHVLNVSIAFSWGFLFCFSHFGFIVG